ncbi:MAG: hypothetical protein JSV88_32530 [Candidatus Aminicenantes bacterium]|nr:MAG: hypothetical protein JSV88_32530 [Candidatus Aminicenantes bacterium]
MKINGVLFFIVFCFSYLFINVYAVDRAVLVHNTLEEIDNCKGKLHLKLIRVWGGDEEEDENKFFRTPVSMVIDENNVLYICDWHSHCIKVFDQYGSYLRTIGRKGQGPGDLYGPKYISFSSEGDILVFEWGGLRFQWFSREGKSKRILKYNGPASWIGVTSRNEIVFYDIYKAFMQRKLISIMNNKGKVLKEFGSYHDKSKNYVTSEKIEFSIDDSDNIYAANQRTPFVRKYSPDGKLLMVITFETPFKIPVEITLTPAGDDIERKEEIDNIEEKVKIARINNGVAIQYNKSKKRVDTGICNAIGIDSKDRIYIVTSRRYLTEKESSGTSISGTVSWLNRELVDYDIVENIDVNQLLVFDQNGKIVAQSPMTTFCDNIYIHDNRIFIIDGFLNQRILEYEMSFKK